MGNINGKETTGLSSNAFRPIAKEMLQAVEMRQRYIKSSNQVFSPTADRHVRLARGRTKSPKQEEMNYSVFKELSMDVPYHPPPEDIDHTPYTDLKTAELPG